MLVSSWAIFVELDVRFNLYRYYRNESRCSARINLYLSALPTAEVALPCIDRTTQWAIIDDLSRCHRTDSFQLFFIDSWDRNGLSDREALKSRWWRRNNSRPVQISERNDHWVLRSDFKCLQSADVADLFHEMQPKTWIATEMSSTVSL